MARLARVVVPGLVYHVTHRGNRRQDVFLRPHDRHRYKRLLGHYAVRHGLEIWSYCLMRNHVHLLALASARDSLARVIGRTHGRFALWQNRRNGWSGHLWENRFYSTPLDEEHLWAAVRYVENNPVRAGLVERAEDFCWSSARSHARNFADGLLSPSRPFPGSVASWSGWLASQQSAAQVHALRRNTTTGRPCGGSDFVAQLEVELGRTLHRRQRGRWTRSGASEVASVKP